MNKRGPEHTSMLMHACMHAAVYVCCPSPQNVRMKEVYNFLALMFYKINVKSLECKVKSTQVCFNSQF